MFTIYLITNRINGKLYVGKTENKLNDRWLKHLSAARCGAKYPLNRAIAKYGEENFTLSVLCHTQDAKDLNQLEMLWIFLLDSRVENGHGYNLTDGGDGVSGRRMSEEAKQRISVANSGKTHSSETRERLRIAHTGRKLPEEQKAKMAAASRGRTHSAETREKLRQINLGKIKPESARRKNSEANKKKSGPTASHFNHNVCTEDIIKLQKSGLTSRQIAAQLGIDKSTVADRLRKAGESLPASLSVLRSERLRAEGKDHLINPNNQDLASSYISGTTVKQLSQQYELAPVSIRHRLKTQGITFSNRLTKKAA